jgi:hypothetical protein
LILLKGSRIIEIVAENLLREGSVALTVKATGLAILLIYFFPAPNGIECKISFL